MQQPSKAAFPIMMTEQSMPGMIPGTTYKNKELQSLPPRMQVSDDPSGAAWLHSWYLHPEVHSFPAPHASSPWAQAPTPSQLEDGDAQTKLDEPRHPDWSLESCGTLTHSRHDPESLHFGQPIPHCLVKVAAPLQCCTQDLRQKPAQPICMTQEAACSKGQRAELGTWVQILILQGFSVSTGKRLSFSLNFLHL